MKKKTEKKTIKKHTIIMMIKSDGDIKDIFTYRKDIF